jgi:hypothetical protein
MPAPPVGAIRPQKNTYNGFNTATVFSGGSSSTLSGSSIGAISGDLLIALGPGRLDSILPFSQLSGSDTVFYDSATPANGVTGGGPVVTSGHKVLARLNGNTWLGVNGTFAGGPSIVSVGMPFQSGLCVALRSGSPGYTICWTPEPLLI